MKKRRKDFFNTWRRKESQNKMSRRMMRISRILLLILSVKSAPICGSFNCLRLRA